MRALISLIAGSMLLNLSARAMANTKKTEMQDDEEVEDESDTGEEEARGLENPQAYENQLQH